MSNNQIEVQPLSARSESSFGDKKRHQALRSASQHAARPTVCCADCKLPLLTDVPIRETLNKSRTESVLRHEQLCRECTQEKMKHGRNTSSRLIKSTSINWLNMSGDIETWFEKAGTPDQEVVYDFLQQINTKKNETTEAQDLDEVLKNLKKYQTRSHSSRPRNKFTRSYESSSWRVLRQPTKPNPLPYTTEPTSDPYNGSIFGTTYRKMGSTFLIHPNWI